MRREADVKKEIKKILAKHKAWSFMPVPAGYGVQGVPDFVVCHHGLFVGVEAKFGAGKQTAWQRKQEGGINEAGGIYLLINEDNLQVLDDTLAGLTALRQSSDPEALDEAPPNHQVW